jgi:hypothetical protein
MLLSRINWHYPLALSFLKSLPSRVFRPSAFSAPLSFTSYQGVGHLLSAKVSEKEILFSQDFNGDAIVGFPIVEESGNAKLLRTGLGELLAQTIHSPIPITSHYNTPINNVNSPKGWQAIGAETVNGQNQVLWQNIYNDYLAIWNCGTSWGDWNFRSYQGVGYPNSAAAHQQETSFSQDLNGDGLIGTPSII